MREIGKKLVHWLALDTEQGAMAIEFVVILGLVVGGILAWMIK